MCRYSQLSCRPCEEGPSQLFYDLLRETYCCNDKNFYNKAKTDVDVQLFGEKEDAPVYA